MARWRDAVKSRPARWALEGVFVVALMVTVAAWQSRGHVRGDAPALALKSLHGEPVTIDTLRGKRTMLVFWAPWCGVCRVESANISWVHSIVGERARVISVASEYAHIDEVRRYIDAQGVDYPVLLGGDSAARAWGVSAFPTVFFLDSEGRVDGSVVGYSTTIGLLARLLM